MLTKNYYIDYGEAAELGRRIGSVMTEIQRLLEEASVAITEMEKTAEQIPAEAECGGLKYACVDAKEEIRRTDFGFYGQRVTQGLERFLDENEWIRNCFVKDMNHNVEKIMGFKAECRTLIETLEYKKGEVSHCAGTWKAVGDNIGTAEGGEPETVLYWPVTRDELLGQAAEKLAGFGMDYGADSSEEAYLEYLEALRRGDYSDMEIVGILASVNMREGAPVINNGTDGMNFNRYRMLLETAPDEMGLPPEVYDCGIFAAYSKGLATEEELCGYIDSLYDQMYICERDYRYLMGVLPTLKHAPQEGRDKTIAGIGELFERRRNVIDAYCSNRERSEIMFYVQISLVMIEEGYDEAFVTGVVGNMMYEGACGEFEDANYETHPEKMGNYLKHVCSCIGYMDKYQGRNVTQVDLVQLYNDVVCIGEVCGYDIHGFGVGSIQWSFSRTAGLLECYLAECGCDVSGRDFQERLEEYQRASESGDFSGYEGIYINAQQVRWAEAAYIIQELGEGDYACVYSEYLNEANSDPEHDVQIATEIIMEEYIKPGEPDKELPKRQAAAAEWYQVVVGGGNL